MVTKAGGLTTFEAIARRLPLAIDVITEPMPQEAGTVNILVEAGSAQAVKKPDDIVKIIENTKIRTQCKDMPLPSFQSLDHIEAIYDIAETILSYLKDTGAQNSGGCKQAEQAPQIQQASLDPPSQRAEQAPPLRKMTNLDHGAVPLLERRTHPES